MFIAKTYGDGSKYNETDIYGPEPSVFDFDIGSTGAGALDDAPPTTPIYADASVITNSYSTTPAEVMGQIGNFPLLFGSGAKYNEGYVYGSAPSIFDFGISGYQINQLNSPPPTTAIYIPDEAMDNSYSVLEQLAAGQVGQRPLSSIFDLTIFDGVIFG